MNVQKIVLPAVAGTLLMTLFSNLIAGNKKKNFSEARLLAKIEKQHFDLPKQFALPAGWATHFSVGILMTIMFEMYKKVTGLKPTLFQTISFGIFAGLLAIGSWKILFKALPNRTNRFYEQYFTQLFFAHLFFSALVSTTQKATGTYLAGY